MDVWYYVDENEEQNGPLDTELMKVLWKNKTIDDSTLVWREGLEEWNEIVELPSLHELLRKTTSKPKAKPKFPLPNPAQATKSISNNTPKKEEVVKSPSSRGNNNNNINNRTEASLICPSSIAVPKTPLQIEVG